MTMAWGSGQNSGSKLQSPIIFQSVATHGRCERLAVCAFTPQKMTTTENRMCREAVRAGSVARRRRGVQRKSEGEGDLGQLTKPVDYHNPNVEVVGVEVSCRGEELRLSAVTVFAVPVQAAPRWHHGCSPHRCRVRFVDVKAPVGQARPCVDKRGTSVPSEQAHSAATTRRWGARCQAHGSVVESTTRVCPHLSSR